VHTSTLGDVDNEVNVGIVVVVGSTGDLDEAVSHADELGVDGEVLWGGHDGELDGALGAKGLVCPRKVSFVF